MVHLMADGLSRDIVDPLLDNERLGFPTFGLKASPQTLGSFGLPASAGDDLFDGDRRASENLFQLGLYGRKVARQNGFGVAMKFNLEARFLERVEHPANLAAPLKRSTLAAFGGACHQTSFASSRLRVKK